MAQLTVRASDDLVARVRLAAASAGRSMNEYVTVVLDAATDANFAGSDAERVRERLARAGLLAHPAPRDEPPPSEAAVRAAGERAASGRSLAELVHEGR